jgi:hypothetical protein
MHTNSLKAGLTFPSNQNPSLQSFKQTGEFNLQTSKIDLNQFEVFLQNLQKENRKEKEKWEKAAGNDSAGSQNWPTAQLPTLLKWYRLSLSSH